jgi:enoyl-[acyl-carrier protein] reductase II
MQTRFTETFGVRLPLACPGMSYIATPELVAATANAGDWAFWPPARSAEQTRAAIRRIRELTDKPFGIGCTLMMPGARKLRSGAGRTGAGDQLSPWARVTGL